MTWSFDLSRPRNFAIVLVVFVSIFGPVLFVALRDVYRDDVAVDAACRLVRKKKIFRGTVVLAGWHRRIRLQAAECEERE
jgi:hypothetical protein